MWYGWTSSASDEAPEGGAPPVDLSALHEMLAPAYPGKSVVAAEVLSGGFANTNFKVTLSNVDTPVVVRVYVRDPSAAYREASILELVKERVPVPEVLHVSPVASEPHTYLILGWVGGVTLDHLLAEAATADARTAVRATGSVLARLQRFQFPRSGFFGKTLDIRTPFASDAGTIVGILAKCLFEDSGEERLGSDLTRRLWRFVTDHEESLGAVEHHSMLVHGDFSESNVMVEPTHGAANVSAVIDWEYAHSGTPLVDLGSMLRRSGHDLAPWFEEELMRGYRQEGGILPANWRQVSRIVDLVKLCAFVRSPNAGDVAVEGVRALVQSALADEHQ